MNDDRERGSLEGPPSDLQPHLGSPGAAEQQTGSQGPSQSAPPSTSQPGASASFELDQPSIISVLYLASFLTGGITAIVGVVLAYVWKDEPKAEWEVSHYQYLINTFWIALVGFFVGFILVFVLIGLLVLPAVMVLLVVRNVLVLVNAQKKQPMPNPGTLLA
jgi:uncharacterized membrane protein